MKKIPTLFKRNPERMREVLPEVNSGCEWVLKGEGVATRKYDGTCCLIKDGVFYKRREVKKGKQIPDDFELVEHDQTTGKSVGWVLVQPSDRWHLEAFMRATNPTQWPTGTYELCGPKVQGNPEGFPSHTLIFHRDAEQYKSVLRTFEGIREFFRGRNIEGLVFHHPDGRMAKIKKRDFGLRRSPSLIDFMRAKKWIG